MTSDCHGILNVRATTDHLLVGDTMGVSVESGHEQLGKEDGACATWGTDL